MYKLTPQKVEELFTSCLFKPEELPETGIPDKYIEVHGLTINTGFHPERLEATRPAIIEMMEEVPLEFFEGQDGGGWSFLNLCARRDSTQWTGEHRVMEQFILMAIGLGLAKYSAPKIMKNWQFKCKA